MSDFKKINLKNNTSSFFKKEIIAAKKGLKKQLNFLIHDENNIKNNLKFDLNKLPTGESQLNSPIPYNFYDEGALNEISRGLSYAILPKLEELFKDNKKITLFDIKQVFEEKKVDPILVDLVMNLILQSRIALPYKVTEPLQKFLAEQSLFIVPTSDATNPDSSKLTATIRKSNEVSLTIEYPMGKLPSLKNESKEEVGRFCCELVVTTSSIHFKKLNFTQTSNSKYADEVFSVLAENNTDGSFLEYFWNKIKQYLGFSVAEADFEIVLPTDLSRGPK